MFQTILEPALGLETAVGLKVAVLAVEEVPVVAALDLLDAPLGVVEIAPIVVDLYLGIVEQDVGFGQLARLADDDGVGGDIGQFLEGLPLEGGLPEAEDEERQEGD